MLLDIETDEKLFFEEEICLFEYEEVAIDVNLKIYIDYHPEYGKSVKRLEVVLLSGYNNNECEDLVLNRFEKREVEEYLKNNLIIEMN
ncbi:hypothetical protein D1632_10625 [Chryseobacterium nematophagum]|uniref:Uncharacterized protein n=1 Tax=Chryseobacterium nematophagum TaxID=2305228 RepID=A0A3M7LBY4_9FLAO|nr:hypothetical protein [Chryseobacterium nematophagum]RMZ60037.1 hypothetical protein D1632_10625 [Chryseobacterium nematophagum]